MIIDSQNIELLEYMKREYNLTNEQSTNICLKILSDIFDKEPVRFNTLVEQFKTKTNGNRKVKRAFRRV